MNVVCYNPCNKTKNGEDAGIVSFYEQQEQEQHHSPDRKIKSPNKIGATN
jgi:hypothetical protein